MIDQFLEFLDSRNVSIRDFIFVVLSLGLLTSMVVILLIGAIGSITV